MRKLVSVLVASAFAAGLSGLAEADGRHFRAKLTPDQEVPPAVADTTGKIKISFNKDFTEAEFELTVREGIRITQAHFHCAPAGVNGPIIVWLAGLRPEGFDIDGKWISNTTLTDANVTLATPLCGATLADLADAMQAGNVYANVHNIAFPGGVVRGQMED